MKSITSVVNGRIVARSKNYSTREEAATVARWINGLATFKKNPGDTFHATVVQNPKTRRPAFYVELSPLSVERQERYRGLEQAKRVHTARTEGERYDFIPAGTLAGVPAAMVTTVSGQSYTVAADAFCTCPDREKVAVLGIECKHSLAARFRNIWSQK